MATIANLTVRISAQIAELQKSFDDAFGTISKFEKQFEGVASSIEAHQQAIKKAFSSFAGDNLLREANAITAAIAKVGGASKLTEAEQKRANATITEAIAKYKALGETAPKALLDLAAATKQIPPIQPPPRGLFDEIIKNAAGVATGLFTAQVALNAVAGAFSAVKDAVTGTVGVFVDSVTHTAALGDELFTLSQKTSLSVESLSAFKFVAAQTNTSVDSITTAVFKLQTNLGKGAKETVAALDAIGLSAAKLRQEDPAQAFTEIIAKIGELPNASQRAAAGVAIFGKAFKDVSQLAQENLPQLIQQAKDLNVVMSQETAVAADRFHDNIGAMQAALEGLKLAIGARLLPAIIAFQEAFGPIFLDAMKAVVTGSQGAGEGFDNFVVQLGEGTARAIEILAKFADAVAAFVETTVGKFTQLAKTLGALLAPVVDIAIALDAALAGGEFSLPLKAAEAEVTILRTIGKIGDAVESAGPKIRAFSQSLSEGAAKAGENFAETYKRIQTEIAASADKMRKSLKNAGDGALDLGKDGKKAAQDLQFVFEAVDKIDKRLQDFSTKDMQKEMEELAKISKAAIESISEQISKFFALKDKLADEATSLQVPLVAPGLGGIFSGLAFSSSQLGTFSLFGQKAAKATVGPFEEAFDKLGKDLPRIILSAIQGGGNVLGAAALGVANIFADSFSDAFKKALDKVNGDLSKLKTSTKALGVAAVGIEAFTSGFALGGAAGSKGKGALAGAGAGAVAGLPLAGATAGLSVGIGAAIGAIGGFFGGQAAQQKTAAALAANKTALAEQFGGVDKLRALAEKLHVNIQAAFDAKKPEQFQKAVDALNSAIDRENQKTAALGKALENVNARAQTFAKQFTGLVETKQGGGDAGKVAAQQIAELAQRTQPEFERISIFVRDTFAGIVKDTGDAIGALQQLAPSFAVLKSGITDFGLSSTAVIDNLLASFDLVNNDAFKPLFENIQETGQLFQSLFDAKALSPEGFQAAAADIGQSIQEIANRGGDISKALALSQPVLQSLFEAQQRFGAITDQTTQSILAQAEEQGLVGENMKNVNDKILDVLLAIAEVLHADIPDGLNAVGAAANNAGKEIQTSVGGALSGLKGQVKSSVDSVNGEFERIKAPKITIPVNVDLTGLEPLNNVLGDPRFRNFGEVPELAAGGVVRRRTLAIIGEAGPEAVVPLSRLQSLKASNADEAPRAVFGPGSIILSGIDGKSIKALVESGDFTEAIAQQFRTNSGGLATAVRRVTA